MNTITFSGKILADARTVNSAKGSFFSFILFETGKGKDAPKLECTQTIRGDEAPSIVEHLKQFATVIVTGTPYAKMGNDKEGKTVPVLACFVDKIDIVHFANQDKNMVEGV